MVQTTCLWNENLNAGGGNVEPTLSLGLGTSSHELKTIPAPTLFHSLPPARTGVSREPHFGKQEG